VPRAGGPVERVTFLFLFWTTRPSAWHPRGPPAATTCPGERHDPASAPFLDDQWVGVAGKRRSQRRDRRNVSSDVLSEFPAAPFSGSFPQARDRSRRRLPQQWSRANPLALTDGSGDGARPWGNSILLGAAGTACSGSPSGWRCRPRLLRTGLPELFPSLPLRRRSVRENCLRRRGWLVQRGRVRCTWAARRATPRACAHSRAVRQACRP